MKNNIDAEIISSFDERMEEIYKERNALDMAGLYSAEKEKEFDSRKEALDKEFKKLLFDNSFLSDIPNGRIIFDDILRKAEDDAEAWYQGEFKDVYECFIFFEKMIQKAFVVSGFVP